MSIPSDALNERSVDRELERKARHDELLHAELGQPPYRYPWGSVESGYDARDGVSEIIIVYDR
jgi:hypothetical protein